MDVLGHQLARGTSSASGLTAPRWASPDAPMSGLDVADGLPTGGAQVTLVCPLLAQSGHPSLHRTCPLLGVKRT